MRYYRQRWTIFAYLFIFSAFGYVQRTGVSIAAEPMMADLSLTQVQFGWLLNSFLIGYTLFQIPGAVVGQRLGARRTLAGISLITVAAASATAAVSPGPACFMLVLLARFVLGMAQSALFPVTSGVLETWFPVSRWAAAQGFLIAGMWVGSAATPPLLAWIMSHWGWRTALIASSLPSLVIIVAWYQYARDRPQEHTQVKSPELEELENNPPAIDRHAGAREVLRLLCDRRIGLLTLSYFLMNYVFYLVTFWCFIYLIQERHFTLLESGGFASLPFIAAAISSGAGGRACDALCARYGIPIGMRMVPVLALPFAAAFLVLTGVLRSDVLAVAALSLSFAFTELTEGPYWTAAMRAAPSEVMASTAVLNTGGNLGGVVATPTIALLTAGHHWNIVFALGAGLSVLAAILWLFIDLNESHASEPASSVPAVQVLSV